MEVSKRQEIRLEILRIALSLSSAHSAKDLIESANALLKFVENE